MSQPPLTGLAQEIRAAMMSILGCVDSLRSTGLTEYQWGLLTTIRKSARDLLAKTASGGNPETGNGQEFNILPRNFDLRGCIDSALSLILPMFNYRGQELITHIEPSAPQRIEGDPKTLQRIIFNLVAEVVMPAAGRDLTLRVTQEDHDGHGQFLRFEVTARVHGTVVKPSERGASIHFQIMRRLVESLGGQLVQDHPARGEERFGCLIPFEAAHHPADRESTLLYGYQALLFDTHPLDRESLRLNLDEWGMEVTVAADVSEFSAYLNGGSISPDLVLLSVNQEHLDSGEFDEYLNLLDWSADYRVLVLTSGIDTKVQKRLLRGGVHACLSMPLQTRGFKRTIFRLLHSQPGLIRKRPKASGFRRRRRPSPQILVVEHDPVSRQRICGFIKQKKACVTIAVNGKQAIEQFSRQAFDLVLMDIHQSRLDGIEVSRRIREIEPYGERIPIVALTAGLSSEEHTELLGARINECLQKPVDMSTLWSSMVKWMAREPMASPLPACMPAAADAERPLLTIDRDDLLRRAGGNEDLIQDILAMLHRDLPQQGSDIQRAFAQGDYERLTDLGRHLGGSASHYGALALKAASIRLERASRTKDEQKVTDCVAALNHEIHRLMESLEGVSAE